MNHLIKDILPQKIRMCDRIFVNPVHPFIIFPKRLSVYGFFAIFFIFSQILTPVLLFFYFTFSRRSHSAPQFLIIYLHLSSAIFFCALFNSLPRCNPCMCIILLDMHFITLQIWIIILFDKNQFPATIVISVVIIYYLWNNNNAWFFRIGEALEKYDSNRSKTN